MDKFFGKEKTIDKNNKKENKDHGIDKKPTTKSHRVKRRVQHKTKNFYEYEDKPCLHKGKKSQIPAPIIDYHKDTPTVKPIKASMFGRMMSGIKSIGKHNKTPTVKKKHRNKKRKGKKHKADKRSVQSVCRRNAFQKIKDFFKMSESLEPHNKSQNEAPESDDLGETKQNYFKPIKYSRMDNMNDIMKIMPDMPHSQEDSSEKRHGSAKSERDYLKGNSNNFVFQHNFFISHIIICRWFCKMVLIIIFFTELPEKEWIDNHKFTPLTTVDNYYSVQRSQFDDKPVIQDDDINRDDNISFNDNVLKSSRRNENKPLNVLELYDAGKILEQSPEPYEFNKDDDQTFSFESNIENNIKPKEKDLRPFEFKILPDAPNEIPSDTNPTNPVQPSRRFPFFTERLIEDAPLNHYDNRHKDKEDKPKRPHNTSHDKSALRKEPEISYHLPSPHEVADVTEAGNSLTKTLEEDKLHSHKKKMHGKHGINKENIARASANPAVLIVNSTEMPKIEKDNKNVQYDYGAVEEQVEIQSISASPTAKPELRLSSYFSQRSYPNGVTKEMIQWQSYHPSNLVVDKPHISTVHTERNPLSNVAKCVKKSINTVTNNNISGKHYGYFYESL